MLVCIKLNNWYTWQFEKNLKGTRQWQMVTPILKDYVMYFTYVTTFFKWQDYTNGKQNGGCLESEMYKGL